MKILTPRTLPSLKQIYDDLGNPSPREVARFLNVSPRTVIRWNRQGRAPHAVTIALFWLTSYGMSAIDAELWNSFQIKKMLSDSLRNENATLRARIARLEKIGRFDSANAPDLEPIHAPAGAVFIAS